MIVAVAGFTAAADIPLAFDPVRDAAAELEDLASRNATHARLRRRG
jgi:hypothetical protein